MFEMTQNVTETKVEKDLENHVYLRLPPEPAMALREYLRSGLIHKDRLSLYLENNMRYCEIRFDHWFFRTKVVDLPTFIETLKTIDGKNVYKTADLCQMMYFREGDEVSTTDDETGSKLMKKDPTTEKKYHWPHGIVPSMKNIRHMRSRKTLKKKFTEAVEIKREIKRLLKIDGEAVNLKWEVQYENEKKKPETAPTKHTVMTENAVSSLQNLAEEDIFGELSDFEDDDEDVMMNVTGFDDDSKLAESCSMQAEFPNQYSNECNNAKLVTEFTKEMFKVESLSINVPIVERVFI